jgi:hypothetical protein
LNVQHLKESNNKLLVESSQVKSFVWLYLSKKESTAAVGGPKPNRSPAQWGRTAEGPLQLAINKANRKA